MKSLKTAFLIFAAVVFVLSAFSFLSTSRRTDSDGRTVADGHGQSEGRSAADTPHERVYIVRREGDLICVYERGSDTPLGRLAIDPRTLPEADRSLLECGILAEGDAQLLALIEDYGS